MLCAGGVRFSPGGTMVIGERLKALRRQKKQSQGDIEKRSGFMRSYISRVENGHIVPSVNTLEKLARALEVPIYRLFTDQDQIERPNIPAARTKRQKIDAELRPFAKLIARMKTRERKLLLHLAATMAYRKQATR
jgi:transcriptional regulator with XRE-family HTH domain